MAKAPHTPLHIIGGGLAGSEAAWQAAHRGVPVILYEMRPLRGTPAHQTEGLAELVCSNSFRSDDAQNNAVGVLHAEMRLCNSLILRTADTNKVPAGGALAVDRDAFSQAVQSALEAHPLITIAREEMTHLPQEGSEPVIIATGPLTSPSLSRAIGAMTGEDELAFFDAIAPIVHKDTINFDIAWFQSRYDKVGPEGDGADYINCPLSREQYETFIDDLTTGEKTTFKDWEEGTPYFDGCLPIEVMAERGFETLRFGPMKPVGLTNVHAPDTKPYAIVQLRQDNKLGTLYNMVGFQTKLKHGAQTRIFRKIPGLENAAFARLGGLHRNTFLNSPKLLDDRLRLRSAPHLTFAGQMTGVEGYVESAAIGLLAGLFCASDISDIPLTPPPPATAMGALLEHITGGADARTFQPMNINFGLFPPIDPPKMMHGKRLRGKEKGRARKQALAARALHDMAAWIHAVPLQPPGQHRRDHSQLAAR